MCVYSTREWMHTREGARTSCARWSCVTNSWSTAALSLCPRRVGPMTVGPSTAVPLTRAVCCLRVPLIAELRRRGVVCSAVRGGQHWFEVPGQTRDLSAEEVASLLKLRKRG